MSLGSFPLACKPLAGSGGSGTTGLMLSIDGSMREGMLANDSLKLTDSLGQRKTASFTLNDSANTYRPDLGDRVFITYNDTRVFGGTIETIETQVIDSPSPFAKVAVKCVDFNQLADRHLVAEVFEVEGQTLGDIVRLLWAGYLEDEGISEGLIEDGPEVVKAVYNYVRLSDAFNELAERTGMVWYIDPFLGLNFHARESAPCPVSFSDSSSPFRSLKVAASRSAYRNQQYVRGGLAETESRVESFVGDGTRKTFNLSFLAGQAPTITVNGVSKTVGIRGIDTGKDWYWNKGEKEITQDDGGTALISSQTLAVTYIGLYPLIVIAGDYAEMTARAIAEGGTGIYESMFEDTSINSLDLANERAEGLLGRYAQLPPTLTYQTDTLGIQAGQIQSVVLTDEQLNDQFLITSVNLTYKSGADLWRADVKATSGDYVGGWVEFFRRLLEGSGGLSLRENEQVNKVQSNIEQVTITDSFNTSDALDDGSGDPYTPAGVSTASDDDSTESGVERGVVG